jgi:hypothetical protein
VKRVPAFQAVLAGEHAAVYAYGVVGAQLAGTADEKAARQAYNLHLSRRDHVTAVLVQDGATPVAAEPGYDIGGPVTSHDEARRLAAQVEAGTAGPYADLVGATDAAERDTATAWLVEAAVRSVRWGGEPTAFPGLAERSATGSASPSGSASASSS